MGQPLFFSTQKAQKITARVPSSPLIMPAIDEVGTTVAAKTADVVKRVFTGPKTGFPKLDKILVPKSIGQKGLEFIGNRAQQMIVGLCIDYAAAKSTTYFYSALDYFNKREETLPQLTSAVNESQSVQDNFKQITPVLSVLVALFHEKMQKRESRIEDVHLAIIENLEETIRLDDLLSSITVEDVEIALKGLTDRLDKILLKHQDNILIFASALDNLKQAEKELSEAQDLLIRAKQDLEDVMLEFSALKLLMQIAGAEKNLKMKELIEKMDKYAPSK